MQHWLSFTDSFHSLAEQLPSSTESCTEATKMSKTRSEPLRSSQSSGERGQVNNHLLSHDIHATRKLSMPRVQHNGGSALLGLSPGFTKETTFGLSLFVFISFFFLIFIYLFGCTRLSCGMWDPVPQPGIESGSPALGVQNFSHRTIREVLRLSLKDEWVAVPKLTIEGKEEDVSTPGNPSNCKYYYRWFQLIRIQGDSDIES